MLFLPCFLCGHELGRRTTKNGKPYFVCDSCGIQLFIRGKHGIERLDEFLRSSEKHSLPFKRHAQKLFEIQAILNDIDATKMQINKLDTEIGFFFPDEDKIAARDSLKNRLRNLLEQLDEIANKKAS